jgi:pyruvate dehydrogenase E1 component
VVATDYARAYPQLIAPYLEGGYITLGTDGFGRSDTRHALRRFFEVDRHSIVVAALDGLARKGLLLTETVSHAQQRYSLDVDAAPPWTL